MMPQIWEILPFFAKVLETIKRRRSSIKFMFHKGHHNLPTWLVWINIMSKILWLIIYNSKCVFQVFVSPPAVRYQHQIVLKGSPGQAQANKIYVLPQKATHSLHATFNPGHNPTSKPMVFFLNSNFGQHNSHPVQPQHPQVCITCVIING